MTFEEWEKQHNNMDGILVTIGMLDDWRREREDMRADIKRLTNLNRELARRINELHKEIYTAHDAITNLNRERKKRDAEIRRLKHELDFKDRLLTRHAETICDRDKEINDLNREIEDFGRIVDGLRDELADADELITELELHPLEYADWNDREDGLEPEDGEFIVFWCPINDLPYTTTGGTHAPSFRFWLPLPDKPREDA